MTNLDQSDANDQKQQSGPFGAVQTSAEQGYREESGREDLQLIGDLKTQNYCHEQLMADLSFTKQGHKLKNKPLLQSGSSAYGRPPPLHEKGLPVGSPFEGLKTPNFSPWS